MFNPAWMTNYTDAAEYVRGYQKAMVGEIPSPALFATTGERAAHRMGFDQGRKRKGLNACAFADADKETLTAIYGKRFSVDVVPRIN